MTTENQQQRSRLQLMSLGSASAGTDVNKTNDILIQMRPKTPMCPSSKGQLE